MTAAQNLAASLTENAKETATKNGMTLEQFAASQIACNNKGARANADVLAVLKDRTAAMAAFDRIAAIEETDSGSSYIPSDKLIAAILA